MFHTIFNIIYFLKLKKIFTCYSRCRVCKMFVLWFGYSIRPSCSNFKLMQVKSTPSTSFEQTNETLKLINKYTHAQIKSVFTKLTITKS